MKKIISITAALICTIFLQNSVIAQEAPKNPANKDLKPIKEESICKEVKKPNFMKFQPPAKCLENWQILLNFLSLQMK